jgi:hypothetical protein
MLHSFTNSPVSTPRSGFNASLTSGYGTLNGFSYQHQPYQQQFGKATSSDVTSAGAADDRAVKNSGDARVAVKRPAPTRDLSDHSDQDDSNRGNHIDYFYRGDLSDHAIGDNVSNHGDEENSNRGEEENSNHGDEENSSHGDEENSSHGDVSEPSNHGDQSDMEEAEHSEQWEAGSAASDATDDTVEVGEERVDTLHSHWPEHQSDDSIVEL